MIIACYQVALCIVTRRWTSRWPTLSSWCVSKPCMPLSLTHEVLQEVLVRTWVCMHTCVYANKSVGSCPSTNDKGLHETGRASGGSDPRSATQAAHTVPCASTATSGHSPDTPHTPTTPNSRVGVLVFWEEESK